VGLISWNDNLSVNVLEIDKEHQKLIGIINNLHDGMRQRKGKEVIGRIISELKDYTLSHFLTEEKYFEKYGYPEKISHVSEHTAFVKKVSEFKKGYDDGKLSLSIEVMDFLSDWLKNHIQGKDKRYSAFFNEKGLK